MSHPIKASTPSDADLAINQVLLAHAELQKNLKRFLGPVTATTNTGSVGADRRDEDQGNVADGGSDDEFVAEDETYVPFILLLAPSCLFRSLGENLHFQLSFPLSWLLELLSSR